MPSPVSTLLLCAPGATFVAAHDHGPAPLAIDHLEQEASATMCTTARLRWEHFELRVSEIFHPDSPANKCSILMTVERATLQEARIPSAPLIVLIAG